MTPEMLRGLPANVCSALAQRSITEAALAELLDVAEADIVLLAGSYATGEEKPTSDLDFLVITAKRSLARPPGSSNHPSIFGDSFDIVLQGLAINIEYVEETRINDVSAILDRARTAPKAPDLPNFQALEARLVQRIHTGIGLTHPERLAEIRASLDIETVRASMAALAFVGAMSLQEDARVIASPARELFHRSAAEALLLAAVNAFGPITYDAKHLCSRASRLASQPDIPHVIQEWEMVAFGLVPSASASGMLLDLTEDLYARFDQPQCPQAIGPMLSPLKAYWGWSGRDFANGPR